MFHTIKKGNIGNQLKHMSIIEDSDGEKKLSTTEPVPLLISEGDSDDEIFSFSSKNGLFPNWQKLVYERLKARDQTTMSAIKLNFEKTGMIDLSNIDANFLQNFKDAFLSAQSDLQLKNYIDVSKIKEHFNITNMMRILTGTFHEDLINNSEDNDASNSANNLKSKEQAEFNQKAPFHSKIPLAERIYRYGLEECDSTDESCENQSLNQDNSLELPFLVDKFDLPKITSLTSLKKRNSTESKEDDEPEIKRPRMI